MPSRKARRKKGGRQFTSTQTSQKPERQKILSRNTQDSHRAFQTNVFSFVILVFAFATFIYSLWSGQKGIWEKVSWEARIGYLCLSSVLFIVVQRLMLESVNLLKKSQFDSYKRNSRMQLFTTSFLLFITVLPLIYTSGVGDFFGCGNRKQYSHTRKLDRTKYMGYYIFDYDIWSHWKFFI